MQTATDFIASIRSCTSVEEERSTITEEISMLRTHVKSEYKDKFPEALLKIMYLTLLGEKTDWAQMFTMKALASDNVKFKLYGYLAAGVILDQTSEISMMITQTLLKDMNHKSPFIQVFALTLVANFSVTEICKNVAQKVHELCRSPNYRVMKAATIAASHIIALVPDLYPIFTEGLHDLLVHKEHCVVLAATKLAFQIANSIDKSDKLWKNMETSLVHLLKHLATAKHRTNYTVDGIEDPFLQISLMRLIQKLDIKSSKLDDILLQIITGLELKNSSSRSVLLQAVDLIGSCSSNKSLRSMGLNQLGKLLNSSNVDANYIALSAFTRILYSNTKIIDRSSTETQALARYKESIIKFISHKDHSLRRRALKVLSALIDSSNIETVIPLILDHLQLVNPDFRSEVIFDLFNSIQRFAPSNIWNFDTVVNIFITNGGYISKEIIQTFAHIISVNSELQDYAVDKLDKLLDANSTNQIFVQVTAWVLGEFATDYSNSLVDRLLTIAKIPQSTEETVDYILVAITMLSFRGNFSAYAIEKLQTYLTSENLQIQQCAGEMIQILNRPELAEFLFAPEVIEEAPKESISSVGLQSLPTLMNNLNHSPLLNILSNLPAQNPVPVFIPPKGSHEVVRTQDFVLFFEVSRNNSNPNQLAIRCSSFNLTTKVLYKFSMQFGIPSGWVMMAKEQSAPNLMTDGNPIQQVIMLENRSNVPLQMKVHTTYIYEGQNISSMDNVKYNF